MSTCASRPTGTSSRCAGPVSRWPVNWKGVHPIWSPHRGGRRNARRADLRRLQPERPRPDDGLAVLGAPDRDRDGVDALSVGRTRRGGSRRLHHPDGAAHGRRPRGPWAGIDSDAQSLQPLLEMVAADEGERARRYALPPSYPKMPGEPPRKVQPSKKVAANWDAEGNPVGNRCGNEPLVGGPAADAATNSGPTRVDEHQSIARRRVLGPSSVLNGSPERYFLGA